MRLLPFALAALLAAAPALADEEDAFDAGDSARDGLLTEAAAVPATGTIRVSAGGGYSPTTNAGTDAAQAGQAGNVGASVLWSVGGHVAAGVGGVYQDGKFGPSVGLRWQFLDQKDMPVNAAASLRYKSIGFQATGSEIEAGLDVGRTFGRVNLAANGVLGKGFAGENAMDVEAHAGASYLVASGLRAGVEGRLRSEFALGEETPKPGREFDLIAGAAVSYRLSMVQLQALAGWGVPRGILATGPAALALASFDF
jgi:hypothetical protein